MASGGSTALSASGARSFDFGSDDVLCSYDDYTAQLEQTANGKLSDQSAKDLHENRVGRPLANIYGQPDEYSREDVLSAVDKCMKKYADNLTRNLEGISGRLTQLELYCFKLERSIGEFRADMIREQNEEDLKLTSLEKHVHEVHRSVQLIRDKQELSETQKELTKLQLSQKDSTNSSLSQKNNDSLAAATSETKSHSDHSDAASNQQLALALPHQIPRSPDQNQPYKEQPHTQPPQASFVPHTQPPQTSLSMPSQDRYVPNPGTPYYAQRHLPPLEHQNQNLQPELHYAQQRSQMRDLPPQTLPFAQYRTQWLQPMQPQQPLSQAHYSSNKPAIAVQPEAYQGGSMPPPPPPSYTAVLVPSGYGASGSSAPHHHHPSQHSMQRQPPPPPTPSQAGQLPFKSGFIGTAAYSSPSTLQGYNAAYVIDGSRASHPQSFQPGSYAASHPYGDMIEKAVSMGFPRDQVADVVQGIAESGQALDLNALLDRLNALASGGTRRPWSG